MTATRIYNDIWYQVADLHVALVHHARIFKQFYRGKEWYVFQDVYANKFFRLTPEAYRFLLKLDTQRTLGEHWEEQVQADPENAPTQDEVVKLLSHLHLSNLLYYRNRSATDDMFERVRKRKQDELKAKMASFLFIRIPVWNPDGWLKRQSRLTDVLFSRYSAIAWVVMAIWAVKTLLDNFDAAWNQTQGVLALDNLVWLYVCMFGLKFLHEMGHAMMTRKFGGPVTNMGLMLLILTPIPYMDASSSWSFRNKYHRMLVGAAGMLVELFIAFIATLVWAATGEGLVHSLAFNIMLIASVSSLVFNGNPLLKFDAYYILSDWLEIPNLYQRSRDQWYYWVERYSFGVKRGVYSPSGSGVETFWMALYAALSSVYRLLVSVSIVLFVAGQWFLLGVVIAVMFGYMWLFKPLFSFTRYLVSSSRLAFQRQRALAVTAVFTLVVVFLVGILPLPASIRAPGVVQAREFYTVFSPVDGLLLESSVSSGDWVKQGQLLARISSQDLEVDLLKTRRQLVEIDALLVQALDVNGANLKPLRQRRSHLQQQLVNLDQKIKDARIIARHEGVYVGDELVDFNSTWLHQRQRLGSVIDTRAYRFHAVVTQDQLADLFRIASGEAEIRLYGDAGKVYRATGLKIVPYEQHELPSAALGWRAGGDIPTLDSDEYGETTQEAFFSLHARIELDAPHDSGNPDSPPSALLHGHTGVMRLELPNEPLASSLWRQLTQMMQKRFLI